MKKRTAWAIPALCGALFSTGCGDLMEVIVDSAKASTREAVEETIDDLIDDLIDVDNIPLPFSNENED